MTRLPGVRLRSDAATGHGPSNVGAARGDRYEHAGPGRVDAALVALPDHGHRLAADLADRAPVRRDVGRRRRRAAGRRPGGRRRQRVRPDGRAAGLAMGARHPRRPVHRGRDLGVRAPARRLLRARRHPRLPPPAQGLLGHHGGVRGTGGQRPVVARARGGHPRSVPGVLGLAAGVRAPRGVDPDLGSGSPRCSEVSPRSSSRSMFGGCPRSCRRRSRNRHRSVRGPAPLPARGPDRSSRTEAS